MKNRIAALLALGFLAVACGGSDTSGIAPSVPPATAPPPSVPSETPEPSPSAPSPAATTPGPQPTGPVVPDFTLATFDDGVFKLSDYRGTLPVVVHFWAPW